MHVSQHGLDLIKEYEGFTNAGRPYWDSYGNCWTQGFGETDGITKSSPQITLAQAEERLKHKLETIYMPTVDKIGESIGHKWTQNQYDSLASIVWNMGDGIIGPNTTLGALLRKKNWRGFGHHLEGYCHDANGNALPGLIARREGEAALFLKQPNPLIGYTELEQKLIREYDSLIRSQGSAVTIARLVEEMTQQRKEIWRAAQETGWDIKHRKARYRSLKARTT